MAREILEVLAELERRSAGVDAVDEQERLPLPDHGVGELPAAPPETLRSPAKPHRRTPAPLEPSVEQPEPTQAPRRRGRLQPDHQNPSISRNVWRGGSYPISTAREEIFLTNLVYTLTIEQLSRLSKR